MVCLNSDPSIRKQGKPIEGTKFMPRTKTNLVTLEPDTCFLCSSPVIDGFCECLVGQDAPPAQREPQLLKVDSEHYIIDSFSTPGVQYHIERNEFGNWMCGCPRYAFKFECKHVEYLLKEFKQLEWEASDAAVRELESRLPLPPMHVFTTPTEVLVGKRKLELEDLFRDIA